MTLGKFSSTSRYQWFLNLSTFRRRQTAAIANRKEIESLFQAISDSNNCIQQMLPNDKKDDMNNIVS